MEGLLSCGVQVISDSFSLCYGGMGVGGGAMVLGGISPPADMVFTRSDPVRRCVPNFLFHRYEMSCIFLTNAFD